MAGYNKELDKQLFAESIDFENSRITVGVYSYNGGDTKVQVVRENKTKDGNYNFAKLGRMNKEEAQAVLPVLEKAVGSM